MAAVYALSGAKVLEARTDTPELVLETGTLAKGLYHVLVQEGTRKQARPAQLVVP
jgi:hypothetical protein